MKTKNLVPLLLLTSMMSCVSPSYFQVYKTVPLSDVSLRDNYLIYEDDNCKVLYNFWEDNGNIGFLFQNKSENTLYLNLGESYFVLNGIAHDYFQNRIFTNTKTSGITSSKTISGSKSITGFNYLDLLQTNKLLAASSSSASSSEEYSVSYTEEKIIAIPSNTAKAVSEFSINNTLYRDCDLFKYPTKKVINTKTFNKSNSPIVFSNRLVYWSEKDQKSIKFENEFYVSEITNYSEADITEKIYEEFCDQKSSYSKLFFKDSSPDKFYLKYTKGTDYWKH